MSELEQPVGQTFVLCASMACRKPIVQDIGPGRRKEHCSETCRRRADRDYKRAKSNADTFQEQLRRVQHEVAAYGRRADEGTLTEQDLLQLTSEARVALVRATTVLQLGGADAERLRHELQGLVAAVSPILESGHTLLPVRSA